jgi:hypothetical protein
VRLAACACLRSLALAQQLCLAPLLEASIHALMNQHSDLATASASSGSHSADPGGGGGGGGSGGGGSNSGAALDLLCAHAHGAAALVSAIGDVPYGCPSELPAAVLSSANALLSAGGERRGASCWLLVCALLTLGVDWVGHRARLATLYSLWRSALAPRVPKSASRAELEGQLSARADALRAVVSFCARLPELVTPGFLKPLLLQLLPPNLLLLVTVRAHAEPECHTECAVPRPKWSMMQ